LHTFDDDTAVLIVSDHGARRMDGGVAINEWLIQQGYLRLNGPYPTAVTRPDMLDIDWSSTMAWGEGGYYGRLFLNIAGREPQGIVKADAVNALLDEIASSLTAMTGPGGPSLGTRCFRPEQLYSRVEGIPPDLLVYFGDLAWRSLGSVGWGRTLVLENDTGPDDANHAQQGVVILDDPADPGAGRELRGAHLLQIAPTLLRHFGIAQPGDMHARPLG
jgi:predicted AlkP superfamily phosphohydrolase/phosphomutase